MTEFFVSYELYKLIWKSVKSRVKAIIVKIWIFKINMWSTGDENDFYDFHDFPILTSFLSSREWKKKASKSDSSLLVCEAAYYACTAAAWKEQNGAPCLG